MMKRELRKYEQQIIKEMESAKFFSWKRIWKAIELSSICDMLSR